MKKERGETIITNHVAKLTGDQIYIKEKRFTVYPLLQSKGVMSTSNKSTFSNKYKSSGGINWCFNAIAPVDQTLCMAGY